MSYIPLGIFSVFIFLKVFFVSEYVLAIEEDSLIEWAQFGFLIISAIVFGIISIIAEEKVTRIISAVLGCWLILWGIEEVSWFQRVLMVDTPEWFFEHNRQHEINMHNIDVIHSILPYAYFLLGCILTFGSFLEPILGRFGLEQLCPARDHLLYFIPTTIVYGSFLIVPPHNGSFMIWRDQEPAELLLSMGMFVFSLTVLKRCEIRAEKLIPVR